jgi:WhiB family redox-sensing transcriptional regulator
MLDVTIERLLGRVEHAGLIIHRETGSKGVRSMEWREHAACLESDPELFFPVGNTGPALDQIDRAKGVCANCEVTEMCLEYALSTGQDCGVWGGLSEDERRALKRRAARMRRAR